MIDAAEQLSQHIGLVAACERLGVPRSSLYRARKPQPPVKPRPTPARALSPEERTEVRQVLNSDRFQDSPPRQVYAILLDEERLYLCHWRTMYRILHEHQQVQERRNQLRHPPTDKPVLLATAPNQLWSWDITELKGPLSGIVFYLYVILDIFSRYIVGWLLADRQADELAQTLIAQTCLKQGIDPHQLTLHADRGGPMRSKTVAELLRDLQVAKTHSRPYTPDDNPYSEAQFKTMKYRPDYPDRFASFLAAHIWTRTFIDWYNNDHHHSGLALMTPAVVHHGLVEPIQTQRQQVLQAAYQAHPERFIRGQPIPPQLPLEVWINKPGLAPETAVNSQ